MNTLGQLGWEVVNFTQVAIVNKPYYVVTFKTPYQLSKQLRFVSRRFRVAASTLNTFGVAVQVG
jgi:hypothetical protein